MSFTFENQGSITYLVYAISEEDTVDSMSLGMLTNNKIPGLAPAIFTQMDETKFIKFNVSAKIPVKQFFEGQVNKKRLLGVFNGIADAMLSAEDYMIDTNTILLDMDYIFADVSTCETVLVCLPLAGKGANADLASFFKNIMFSTQFDQTENCDYVGRIINYLNGSPVFSLVEFKGVLDSLKGAAAPAPQPARQPVQQSVPQPVRQPVQQPVPQPAPQPIPQPTPRPVPQPTPAPQPAPKPAPQPIPQPTPRPAPQPVPQPAPAPTPNPQPAGEKMSLFYLMQHYNKENKAIYDAQKAAGKAAKGQGASPAPVPTPPKKQDNVGFAIPGQGTNPGFAIPGQPTPMPGATTVKTAPTPAAPGSSSTQAMSKPAQPKVQQAPPVQQTPVQRAPVQQAPVQQTPVQKPAYQPPVQQTPVSSGSGFGDTTVLSGGGARPGETTVLGGAAAETQPRPHLIRAKNNERINLDKPVFRIGKEKSYVDYFVSDNTAVSRSHCNIISRDGQYLIVDTNSTNHTYVNGGMIQSMVETPLSHGTKIRLANEEFEFRLY